LFDDVVYYLDRLVLDQHVASTWDELKLRAATSGHDAIVDGSSAARWHQRVPAAVEK